MKKLTILVLLLMPMMMGPTNCSPFGPYKTVFIGDSIIQGAGSGPGFTTGVDDFFSLLDADSRLSNHVLSNLGCGGASTFDWVDLATLTSPPCGTSETQDLLQMMAEPGQPYFHVYIMLGTNDSTGFFNPSGVVTSEEYKANMIELIERLAPYSARIVIMTPPPIPANITLMIRLGDYVNKIHEICNEVVLEQRALECATVDVFNELDATDFHNGDMHPNAQGHAKIHQLIIENLHVE